MFELDKRISKNKYVPYRIIEGEAVLVDVERGNVIQLNEVAAFIWEHIDGEKNAREIIDCVCNSFEVDKNKAEKDALEFLNGLLKKCLIILK